MAAVIWPRAYLEAVIALGREPDPSLDRVPGALRLSGEEFLYRLALAASRSAKVDHNQDRVAWPIFTYIGRLAVDEKLDPSAIQLGATTSELFVQAFQHMSHEIPRDAHDYLKALRKNKTGRAWARVLTR